MVILLAMIVQPGYFNFPSDQTEDEIVHGSLIFNVYFYMQLISIFNSRTLNPSVTSHKAGLNSSNFMLILLTCSMA